MRWRLLLEQLFFLLACGYLWVLSKLPVRLAVLGLILGMIICALLPAVPGAVCLFVIGRIAQFAPLVQIVGMIAGGAMSFALLWQMFNRAPQPYRSF